MKKEFAGGLTFMLVTTFVMLFCIGIVMITMWMIPVSVVFLAWLRLIIIADILAFGLGYIVKGD